MGTYRVIPLILSTFECIIFSGLLFSWASLVYVLKADDVFGHLCEDTIKEVHVYGDICNTTTCANIRRGICDSQENTLALVDTISMSFFTFLYFPVGFCLDRWGLRPIRTFGR